MTASTTSREARLRDGRDDGVDGYPTSELADGGKRESPAGGARGGGHPVRARLTLCGVREWAARGCGNGRHAGW